MRKLVTVMLLLALVTVSGCASRGESGPSDPEFDAPRGMADHAPKPWDLVGLWRVSDAEGADRDTWLYLGADEARLWSDCGFQFGGWTAGDGRILIDVYAWHEDCMADGGKPVVDWLAGTVAYTAATDGWTLLSQTGEVTAHLTIDGAPPRHPHADDTARQQPVVDDDLKARFARIAIPAGMRAARADDLLGRWVPEVAVADDVARGFPGSADEPHLVVDADGTWTASDGCNASAGRWTVTPDGSLLTTAGPSTLIGCAGSAEPGRFGTARAAAFDDDVLVLFDADGAAVARLGADD